jgi:hypothetical protein
MVATESEFAAQELLQGDILERNELLAAAIGQAHQYYAFEAVDYTHFLVLTPTCELVRRDGRCSSRYISLAAIRPLSLVFERQLRSYKQSIKAPGVFCSSVKRPQAEQFAMRLLHNAEDGYLFLPGELFGEGEEDRCAFLKLSIAIRIDHYDVCLKAKIKQLAKDYSAKVGFLTANLYGQVATQAIEEQSEINFEEIIAEYKIRNLDRSGVYWLSPQRIKHLRSLISAKRVELNRDLYNNEVSEIVSHLKGDQELLVDRIMKLIAPYGMIEDGVAETVKNELLSDQYIGQFLPR